MNHVNDIPVYISGIYNLHDKSFIACFSGTNVTVYHLDHDLTIKRRIHEKLFLYKFLIEYLIFFLANSIFHCICYMTINE